MEVYYIEVIGIPEERVHEGLKRDWSVDTCSLFLTPQGRLTDNTNTRANIENHINPELLT